MHQLEPWTSEPSGEGFVYFLRKSGDDGTSGKGGKPFVWPKIGYVECEKWEGDDPPGRIPPGWGFNDGGLWGFIHGKGNYRLAESMYPGGVYQVCKIALAEARYGRGQSYRVPRAWVCFVGSGIDVFEYLRNKNDPYCRQVALNFANGVTEANRPGNLADFFKLLF